MDIVLLYCKSQQSACEMVAGLLNSCLFIQNGSLASRLAEEGVGLWARPTARHLPLPVSAEGASAQRRLRNLEDDCWCLPKI